MASAVLNTCSVPLLAGRFISIILKKITVFFYIVRGPGAVQLVTSPADQAEVNKVAVFDVENCRLTCFSRSGHQFVISNKDEFVFQVNISKFIYFIFIQYSSLLL